MEWTSAAIVLGAKKHGEGHAVLDVLTKAQGFAKGYVRGGSGRRQRPTLEPGNLVEVTWRGRLDEHLGTFRVELEKSQAAELFRKPSRLAALNATTSLLSSILPEREPCPDIYAEMLTFLALLGDDDASDLANDLKWGAELVRLECMLLTVLGFGLDLEKCAATGEVENLTHVSPKTGRAVSLQAAQPYKDKLLALPGFLLGKSEPTKEDILAGLRLTGYFFKTHMVHVKNAPFEEPRQRLLGYFS